MDIAKSQQHQVCMASWYLGNRKLWNHPEWVSLCFFTLILLNLEVISVPFLSAASGTRTFVDIFYMYIVLHMEGSKSPPIPKWIQIACYILKYTVYVYKAV